MTSPPVLPPAPDTATFIFEPESSPSFLAAAVVVTAYVLLRTLLLLRFAIIIIAVSFFFINNDDDDARRAWSERPRGRIRAAVPIAVAVVAAAAQEAAADMSVRAHVSFPVVCSCGSDHPAIGVV